jgi:ATP synthase protein I
MMSEDKSPKASKADVDESDRALAGRLAALERSLKAVSEHRQDEKRSEKAPQGNSGLGQALRLSGEFTAGIIVGGGFGWGFDRWLGTSPWGMMLFLMLGFAAGVYNVMRSAGLLKPARSVQPPKL